MAIYTKIHMMPEGNRVYEVQGPLFSDSAAGFIEQSAPKSDPVPVFVDSENSCVADKFALQAIEAVTTKY
ncbi:MAG: hypothetical protein GDA36_02500 [Rhodobacteraceae bacterium]|nr:hypothetical protein [Paracoccaceae bacterium]